MNYHRLLVVFLLFATPQILTAQKKVLLKVAMAPGKTYKSQLLNKMDMEMTMDADSVKLAQLNASGMKLPIKMLMTQDMETTTKMGAKRADKRMPITITYDKMTITQSMNGQENTIPSQFGNAVVEGTGLGDGKIDIDTIKGVADAGMRASLRQMVGAVQSNVNFPDKEMKVGDSFDQELPMDMPMPQAKLKMIIAIKYTLKELRDNLAIFDMIQNIRMDLDAGEGGSVGNGKGIGNGSGTMTFDSQKGIIVSTDSDIQFKFSFAVADFNMSADCKAKTNLKVDVE